MLVSIPQHFPHLCQHIIVRNKKLLKCCRVNSVILQNHSLLTLFYPVCSQKSDSPHCFIQRTQITPHFTEQFCSVPKHAQTTFSDEQHFTFFKSSLVTAIIHRSAPLSSAAYSKVPFFK